MKLFLCLLDAQGRGVSEKVRRAYESLPCARGLNVRWWSNDQVNVLTAWDEPHTDPLIARQGNWVAVGMVRLDNRVDLERWTGCEREEITDLELVLRVVAAHGTKYIPQFLGDFGFIAWNSDSKTGVAACDVFAVKKLYYRENNGSLAFASRADLLAMEERYELQYLLELLVTGAGSRGLSPYVGVRPVPAASLAVLEEGRLDIRPYWSTTDFTVKSHWAKTEGDAVDTCRYLLMEAVRLRVANDGTTWAELSGGLDSSSVVSLAQWLAQQGDASGGLGGSVTYVDRQGTGADEREYSEAVVTKWPVRNEVIVDAPTWGDDHHAPPYSDQPSFGFASYARVLRVCSTVRSAGGRVLLTGFGGDELFAGSMLFFADWLAQGRVWAAVREMARRAAIGRVSFWELAYRNAVLPFLPRAAQYWRAQEHFYVAPWLRREMMQRYELSTLHPLRAEFEGQVGDKYRHSVAVGIAGLARFTNYDALADLLDVRHPFLYRPLAEFALQLPPELRARPYAHRWVFREAMRGILPDAVRTRVGKTDAGSFLAWSLATRREQLLPLLHEPILAELGLIDAIAFRSAFDTALHQRGRDSCMYGEVFGTLEVEAWLQMRSGRWPRGGDHSTATSQPQANLPSS